MKGMLGGLYMIIFVVSSINAVVHCSGSLLSDAAMILASTFDRTP